MWCTGGCAHCVWGMAQLDEFDLLELRPPPPALVVVGPTPLELLQFEYEEKLRRLQEQMRGTEAELAHVSAVARFTLQELDRVSGEMGAWVQRGERRSRRWVQPHLTPAPPSVVGGGFPVAPLLYADVAGFQALRMEGVQARVDMLAGVPSDLAELRLRDIAERRLTDFEVEQCLVRRKGVLEEKYVEEVPAGTPLEQVLTPVAQQRIQDAVLQLFKVLHRRRLAVLQGHKLPPLDSVFGLPPQ